MYILSLDTTAKTAAACVCEVKNDDVFPLCSAQLNSTLTHSESILPMIDFCLKNSNITTDDIDLIGVSNGPGSFTGVRIGVSTAKGLAFSNNIKCVAVSTLEALALNVHDEQRSTIICPVMDARRNQFYNALFSCNGKGGIKRLCEDRAVDVNELFEELCAEHMNKKIVLVGDGAFLAYQLFSKLDGFEKMKLLLASNERIMQNAVSVARSAYQNVDKAVDAGTLNPVYLRLSQAERERNERLGI